MQTLKQPHNKINQGEPVIPLFSGGGITNDVWLMIRVFENLDEHDDLYRSSLVQFDLPVRYSAAYFKLELLAHVQDHWLLL